MATCPPQTDFSKIKTENPALAAYKAAVKPAGPAPIMITSFKQTRTLKINFCNN